MSQGQNTSGAKSNGVKLRDENGTGYGVKRTGNVPHVLLAGNAEGTHLFTQQEVVADTNNSSTTNLAAGNSYTFTGTATSTLGVAGIQVSLYTDKNCTVAVQQSPDGDNWDLIDDYEYFAEGNFGITVQAISSYVRVIVATNALTTTVFRLQTALCPIVEAVPRSLDEHGFFQVGIKSSEDLYGFEAENTPMGEQRVIVPTRLIGTNFEGTSVDANFWTASVANDGTVTQANAQAVLATTTTSANGTARLYSVRRARYVSGFSQQFRAVVQLSAGAADNKRRWGIAFGATMPTITDGAYFELDGTTCSIVTNKGGSEVRVSSGDFNGILGKTFTFGTGVRTYEIYWTNSKVYFVIGGEILHTVSATSATWAATMNFHIYMDSVNSNSLQTNNTLTCRVASIRRLGPLLTQPTSYYFAAGQTAGVNLKLGAGNLHSLIVNNVVNNAVITLSDSTSAATPAIFVHTAGATSTAAYALDFKGLPFFTGLRLTVASFNASVTIIYE